MPVLLRHSRHITGRSRSEAKQLQGRGTRGSRRRLQGPLRPGLPRRGRRRLRTGRRRRRHEGPRLSGLRPPNSNPDISVRVGFWKGDYGWGVRVRRPFGARGMSSVRYGTRLGDLKNKQPTESRPPVFPPRRFTTPPMYHERGLNSSEG